MESGGYGVVGLGGGRAGRGGCSIGGRGGARVECLGDAAPQHPQQPLPIRSGGEGGGHQVHRVPQGSGEHSVLPQQRDHSQGGARVVVGQLDAQHASQGEGPPDSGQLADAAHLLVGEAVRHHCSALRRTT
eukprot:CAMPEP_0173337200 /NCGR_PEP_ID=MMETSP1144-20121109/7011_1 /TAXON_ID=483371 /ORGANISM="non described non described, Strain CCMP2298" /LENGTH=130 /DNA_ID=CAMNT_0014282639 /DNA_START=963 /DNA_END=1352 /DNA_ORIENTATION=-